MKYEGYSNEKDKSQKYHGFQFFKQHSFKEFTLGNYLPMFYGKPFYSKRIDSITGELKDNGFITCGLTGVCDKEGFYYDWQLKEGMERIRQIIQQPARYFAYPYGTFHEIGEREFRIVEKLGIQLAFMAHQGCITSVNMKNVARLPRVYLKG